jgi:hypothetical protein
VAVERANAQAHGAEVNVYLASPGSQMHADYLSGMPVLLSFALYQKWLKDYHPSFKRILIDSGAYSELNSGKKVDIGEYREWSQDWLGHADAVAGLDDIGGDWRRSLKNYEAVPWGFPTMHDSDPAELLDELIPMARERGNWLGIGLVPPRHGKESWIRETLARVPEDIHVHGWACRAYTHVRRFDSVDSTNWFRDALKYKTQMPFLTPAECVEIVVKRYQRWSRVISTEPSKQHRMEFAE